jgi:hypothetical protein
MREDKAFLDLARLFKFEFELKGKVGLNQVCILKINKEFRSYEII